MKITEATDKRAIDTYERGLACWHILGTADGIILVFRSPNTPAEASPPTGFNTYCHAFNDIHEAEVFVRQAVVKEVARDVWAAAYEHFKVPIEAIKPAPRGDAPATRVEAPAPPESLRRM